MTSKKGSTWFGRSVVDRFWDKVEIIPFHSCWEWTAYKNKDGYGVFGGRDGKPMRATRFIYQETFGDLDPTKDVCHHCDNPGCVRPEHLFQGRVIDNINDAKSKHGLYKRFITHCPAGHEYSKENTYKYTTKRGHNSRSCRACRKIINRERYLKKLLRNIVT